MEAAQLLPDHVFPLHVRQPVSVVPVVLPTTATSGPAGFCGGTASRAAPRQAKSTPNREVFLGWASPGEPVGPP